MVGLLFDKQHKIALNFIWIFLVLECMKGKKRNSHFPSVSIFVSSLSFWLSPTLYRLCEGAFHVHHVWMRMQSSCFACRVTNVHPKLLSSLLRMLDLFRFKDLQIVFTSFLEIGAKQFHCVFIESARILFFLFVFATESMRLHSILASFHTVRAEGARTPNVAAFMATYFSFFFIFFFVLRDDLVHVWVFFPVLVFNIFH